MAETAKLENLEFKVSPDVKGLWEHQGTRVRWETRDLKAQQEFLVHLDLVETPGRMVPLEPPDHLVSLDLLEREVWLGPLGREVSKECRVLLVKMESPVVMELLECKVRQE